MEKDFWLERWKQAEIGFHQDEIHPYLRQYWQELLLARHSEVFVPLCGKSLDMVWLREQSFFVLGVELSSIAVRAFFSDQGQVTYQIHGDKFTNYMADGVCLACGDFFDLSKDDLAQVVAVYDRASMVALPPEMRERYVRHLVSILPRGTRILLITFDYAQTEMPGPPFAVSTSEVETLYRNYAEIRLLAQKDVLTQNKRFQDRGVTHMQENVFLLTLH